MINSKLSIKGTLCEAFSGFCKEWKTWLFLFFVPGLLIAIGTLAVFLFAGEQEAGSPESLESILTSLLMGVLSLMAGVIYTVRIIRYKLLNEPIKSLMSFEWKRRHWVYVGVSILVGLSVIGAAIVPIFMAVFFTQWLVNANPDLDADLSKAIMLLTMLIALLPAFYIMSRLYLFQVFISLDKAGSYSESWKWTRGGFTWLKILVFVLVATLAILVVQAVLGLGISFIALAIPAAAFVGILFLSLMTTFISYTVTALGLSSIYKQLLESKAEA